MGTYQVLFRLRFSTVFWINTGQSGLRFIFDIEISIYRDTLSRFYKQYDFNLRTVVTHDVFVIHCGNDNLCVVTDMDRDQTVEISAFVIISINCG